MGFTKVTIPILYSVGDMGRKDLITMLLDGNR